MRNQALFQIGARIFAPREQTDRLRLQRDRSGRPHRYGARSRPGALGVGGERRTRRACDRHTDGAADLGLDLGRDILMLAQPFAGVVLALADLVAVIRVPRARLLDDVVDDAELDDLALAGDA